MREPHPEDFDPNYASKVTPEEVDLKGIEPIKTREQIEREIQKADAESVTNGKVQDQTPPPDQTPEPKPPKKVVKKKQPKKKKQPATKQSKQEQKPDKSTALSEVIPVTLSRRRQTQSRNFEFYKDQIDTLKKIKKEAKAAGGYFNQSEFVRDALDEHLAKLKK